MTVGQLSWATARRKSKCPGKDWRLQVEWRGGGWMSEEGKLIFRKLLFNTITVRALQDI